MEHSRATPPSTRLGRRWAAGLYEKGRPDYPRDALESFLPLLAPSPDAVVLEVGAGTGKLTRALAGDVPGLIAVEPSREMRTEFRRRLRTVPLVAARAERLPFRASTFDGIVVAQAFHWFPARPTLREFARVLRPGKPLVLLWNRRDDRSSWLRRLSALLAEYDPGVPRTGDGRWKDVFVDHPVFAPLRRRRFSMVQRADLPTLRARVRSVSFISALPTGTQREVVRRLEAIVREEGALARGGRLDIPYVTDVYLSRRRERPARR